MALVVSRKMHEKIVIQVPPGAGGEIEIHPVELRGNRVRIAVEAPPAFVIWRGELLAARETEVTR